MNPLEKQAHDAEAMRTWAEDHDKPHLLILAEGLEKDLSRQLTARYEASRGVTRAPEYGVPTPDQERTLKNLHLEYDELEVRYGRNGRLHALCINYGERGERIVESTHVVHPDGLVL